MVSTTTSTLARARTRRASPSASEETMMTPSVKRGVIRATTLTLLVLLGATTVTSCTDLTIPPKSTLTDANVFNDPNSYRSFIARVYSGLQVSGQQGPAGRPDIQGIDEGFSQYLDRKRV